MGFFFSQNKGYSQIFSHIFQGEIMIKKTYGAFNYNMCISALIHDGKLWMNL